MPKNRKNLDEVYIFHLEKAFKQFKKYKNKVLKSAGIDLTSDQWVILKGISELEGISQIDLAKRTFKEPASVTRILDILERKGLVERRDVDHSRRTYGLWMTESGKQLVEKMIPLAIEIRAKGVSGMSDIEQAQLQQLLIKLYDNFKI
ncbi:MAG: MarR family transcriptional regulator [Saprospiraceae bacterium]